MAGPARAFMLSVDSIGDFISGANHFLDIAVTFHIVGTDGSQKKLQIHAIADPDDTLANIAAAIRTALVAAATPLGFTFAANQILLITLTKA